MISSNTSKIIMQPKVTKQTNGMIKIVGCHDRQEKDSAVLYVSPNVFVGAFCETTRLLPGPNRQFVPGAYVTFIDRDGRLFRQKFAIETGENPNAAEEFISAVISKPPYTRPEPEQKKENCCGCKCGDKGKEKEEDNVSFKGQKQSEGKRRVDGVIPKELEELVYQHLELFGQDMKKVNLCPEITLMVKVNGEGYAIFPLEDFPRAYSIYRRARGAFVI